MKLAKDKIGLLALPVVAAAAYFLFRKKSRRYLAIEVGGTYTRVALVEQDARNPLLLTIVSNRIYKTETKTPEELVNYIKQNFSPKDFSRIAISSFGPLNLRPGKSYGVVTAGSAPQKLPWVSYSLAQRLSSVFGKEAKVETDVNASALAEHFVGYADKRSSLAYITIGTGVGVGLVIDNKPVHGYQHPEGGHNLYCH